MFLVAELATAQCMMGPGFGGNMMGGDYISPDNANPIAINQVHEVVKKYLSTWANPDLTLAEIMEFSNHFYVEVEEESTGIHAFELLVDKYTGAVFPEPGPNMMWNIKYGHMGGRGMMGRGMMGGPWGGRPGLNNRQPSASEMPLSPEQAREYAQRYLDYYSSGTEVAEEADRFYGYYTIHVLKGNRIYGMLSVNGFTGQVWYHTWHGEFLGMKEYD